MKVFMCIMYVLLFSYLIYLSYKDIKNYKLEYMETGLLFPISFICCVLNIMNSNDLLYTIIDTILGVIIVFVLMFAFASIKVKGSNAFGGADIWVLTILSFSQTGINNSLISIMLSCVAFLIYVLARKLFKKEKKDKYAFVPFITVGTIITFILRWFGALI